MSNTDILYGYADGQRVAIPVGESVAAYATRDGRAQWNTADNGFGLFRVVMADFARPIWDARTDRPAVTTSLVIDGKTQRIVMIEGGKQSVPFADMSMTRRNGLQCPCDPRLTTAE